jgi:hypothetical protein
MTLIKTSAVHKVFQNRDLTLLWLGQMFSQSGDSIYQIGLLWLACSNIFPVCRCSG